MGGVLNGLIELATSWSEVVLGTLGDYPVQVLKIIGIDLVLAGDNAVVIALACRTLPPRQRLTGIVLGALAAVVMRILFTLAVQKLLDIQLLKLAGGILLFWIAVKLLLNEEGGGNGGSSGSSLWEAVRIVALADMVMSLDNVLAVAAAAHGDPLLIVFGLAVSIPLVVGGATIITGLLTRFPILVWAGAALLGWVAGELIATEPAIRSGLDDLAAALHLTSHVTHRLIELAGAVLVCIVAYAMRGAMRDDSRA